MPSFQINKGFRAGGGLKSGFALALALCAVLGWLCVQQQLRALAWVVCNAGGPVGWETMIEQVWVCIIRAHHSITTELQSNHSNTKQFLLLLVP